MPKTLSQKLNSKGKAAAEPKQPLWKGPEVDGITQSLLSRFLVCRERFRLLTIEGLQPTDGFNHHLEYGQMWHTCEEALAAQKMPIVTDGTGWQTALLEYTKELIHKYRMQQEQVQHWYEVCKRQFPEYIKYWSKHPDVKDRTPLLQETSFRVPYKLPSGRTVTLRGKWDSVDLIGKGKNARVYLMENKTKGDINEEQLKKQLSFDMQTMIYIIALNEHINNATAGDKLFPVDHGRCVGVRYNVIRRPLSGGKGSIRQHQPSKSNPQGESKEHFYDRLLNDYIKPEPEYWFMRWKCEVSQEDCKRFEQRFLIPVLEQLWDWWEFIQDVGYDPWKVNQNNSDPLGGAWGGCGDCGRSYFPIHYQHPHGVYNVLLEGGSSELDEYIQTGSSLGLQRATTLFSELE